MAFRRGRLGNTLPQLLAWPLLLTALPFMEERLKSVLVLRLDGFVEMLGGGRSSASGELETKDVDAN